MSEAPLVTIGVTTFDRVAMLLQCLQSIGRQTRGSFEVIVGNDDPSKAISGTTFDLEGDARFRFVNHPGNLGELGNMNYLLGAARGDYFTWLADDDAYAPNYLAEMVDAVETHDADVAFCGFHQGNISDFPGAQKNGETRVYKGCEFLSAYLRGDIKTLGVYGLFHRKYLSSIGGIRQLGAGFSPYSDNLLAIEAGQFDRVVFHDAPLVFFRTHPASVSFTSRDLSAFVTAQVDLADRCGRIFRAISGTSHKDPFTQFLFRWFVRDFCGLVLRCGGVSIRDMAKFAAFGLRKSSGATLRQRLQLGLYLAINLVRSFMKLAIGRR
jgi:glycosyltransferase involved in cell wall biosynthesis